MKKVSFQLILICVLGEWFDLLFDCNFHLVYLVTMLAGNYDWFYCLFRVMVMVFNATFNNISVAVTFIRGRKPSTRRKPPTFLKSLPNFIT